MFRKVLEDFYCVGFRTFAIGRTHMIVVDDDGYCYSTGLGARGQLGQGSAENCCVARRVAVVQKIVGAACGESHSVFLDDSGRVYACGKSDDGQLGLRFSQSERRSDETDDHKSDVLEPQVMESIAKYWMKQIACGAHHTLLLDATGHVWGCGRSDFGQLGQSSTLSSPLPAPIPVPLSGNDKVVHIAAGDTHSLFVTASGLVYACGNGEHGQLGIGDDTEDLVAQFDKLITARPSSSKSDNKRNSKGLIEEGEHPYWDQVQRGSIEARECDRHRPTLMRFPPNTRIVTAAAGRHHSVLIDDKGGVWVCGSGQFGELCCGELTFFASPTLVPNTGTSPITMEQLRKQTEERQSRSNSIAATPPQASSLSSSSKDKGLFGDGLESAVFDEPIEPTRRRERAPSQVDASKKTLAVHEVESEIMNTTDTLPLRPVSEPQPQIEALPPVADTAEEDQGRIHVMEDGSLVHAFTTGSDPVDTPASAVQTAVPQTKTEERQRTPSHPLDN